MSKHVAAATGHKFSVRSEYLETIESWHASCECGWDLHASAETLAHQWWLEHLIAELFERLAIIEGRG